jgi:hypothetical protein
MVMVSRKKFYDLAERVVMTFVGVFVALYIPTMTSAQSLADLYDKSALEKATTAGIAGSAVMLAGLFGFNVGDRKTASLLPELKKESWEIGSGPVDKDAPQDSPAPLCEEEDHPPKYLR